MHVPKSCSEPYEEIQASENTNPHFANFVVGEKFCVHFSQEVRL